MRMCFALAAMLFVVDTAVGDEPKASDVLKPQKNHEIASPITDRFALRISYFHPKIDTKFRLDQDNGTPGTLLDAEQDLGLNDTENQVRAEMIFRLRERNRLRVDYFKLGRSGDVIITGPISFGNQVFNANDRVQTLLDWRQLGLTYTRSVWRSERVEVGVGLGIALLEAKARGEVPARNVREDRSGVGAFPTLALDGTWRISKRWSLTGRGQQFSAHVSDFHGLMSEYHGDVQYRWAGNFAFGLGYTRMRTHVDVANSDFAGLYHQDLSGGELFIRASF